MVYIVNIYIYIYVGEDNNLLFGYASAPICRIRDIYYWNGEWSLYS